MSFFPRPIRPYTLRHSLFTVLYVLHQLCSLVGRETHKRTTDTLNNTHVSMRLTELYCLLLFLMITERNYIEFESERFMNIQNSCFCSIVKWCCVYPIKALKRYTCRFPIIVFTFQWKWFNQKCFVWFPFTEFSQLSNVIKVQSWHFEKRKWKSRKLREKMKNNNSLSSLTVWWMWVKYRSELFIMYTVML